MEKNRLQIAQIEQQIFFRDIKKASNLTSEEMGKLCSVSSRTIRDWMRGKFSIPKKTITLLSEKFKVPIPKSAKTVNAYWHMQEAAKLGGKKRFELYGAPGNKETRRQAGIISQLKRKEDPEKYRILGCNVRKNFHPFSLTANLAEMFGILLGDGGITDYQIKITLSALVDREYSLYVYDLCKNTFGAKPVRNHRNNVIIFTISGIGIVEELEKLGLKRGNKVRHQVSIPNWISNKPEYLKACIRGLFDTDGCVYTHNHTVQKKQYYNCGVTFSNKSKPLIDQVYQALIQNGIKAKISGGDEVFIYSLPHVKKYMELIGSSNPKHKNKLNQYLKLTGK